MKISVVIADGSDIVRSGLRQILSQSKSISVCSDVENTDNLLESIEKHKPNVVLIDYTSKGFDLASITKVKVKNNHTRLIGITHSPSMKVVNSALASGLISHIKKDCPTLEILDSVIETANDKHFFCGEILEVLKDNNNSDNEIDDNQSLNCAPITLSDRELDVVKLIAEGYTNAQVAVVLHISNHTVNTHRKNIMRKLGIGNTAGIVMFAVKTNIVSPDKFEFSPIETT